MTDAMSVAFLLKSFGYGFPIAILALTFLVLKVLVKYQKEKNDRDRREHMLKWESMISVQRESVQSQKETTDALIKSHHEEMERVIKQQTSMNASIIENHRSEINRMLDQHQRQASSLEAMAHNLSIISQRIEQVAICPLPRKE